MFGDATCSLINYAFTKNNIVIGSTDYIVAKSAGSTIDDRNLSIRNSSDLSQCMPNDITVYEDVYVLLPNNILDLSKKRVIRIPFRVDKAENYEIIDTSISLISNIVSEYKKYFLLACPLTAGYDSRLVYSFLRKIDNSIPVFTIKYNRFNDETADLNVPKKICELNHQKHVVINYLDAPIEYCDSIKQSLGEYQSDYRISQAYTFKNNFDGYAFLSGDIIGQIGNSLIGNDVPDCLATASFFQCKEHNYSKGCKTELQKWINNVRKIDSETSLYDLFAIENRCSRWAGQLNTAYSACGIDYINVANCRELLKLWMTYHRKLRVKRKLHKEIMKEISPDLLQFDFNPGSLDDFMSSNWVLFYISTFLKRLISQI